MRTVEDGLELIVEQMERAGSQAFDGLLGDAWTRSFLESVGDRVASAHALSTQQGVISLKLIDRVAGRLIGMGLTTDEEVKRLVLHPAYRITPYPSSNVPREVRHMGDDRFGFRFKWNMQIVRDIKNLANFGMACRPWFDAQYSIWLVPVSRVTLDPMMRVIAQHRFGFGEDVVAYLERCEALRDLPSRFDVDEQTGLLLATVHDNILLASWALHVEGGELV